MPTAEYIRQIRAVSQSFSNNKRRDNLEEESSRD